MISKRPRPRWTKGDYPSFWLNDWRWEDKYPAKVFLSLIKDIVKGAF
jgi:hypothetical protein